MSLIDNTKLEPYEKCWKSLFSNTKAYVNTSKVETITSYEQIPFGHLPKKFDDKPDDSTPEGMVAEAARKREHRLIKNREAARECRRKKKEYIKVS